MKTLKNLILMALLCSAVQLNAQTDKATTAKIVAAQNYVFVATTAYPQNSSDISRVMDKIPGSNGGGGTINLTGSTYDLKVTPDSLVAYLPYYGRSYTPKIGSTDDSGIKFKSKKFSYNVVNRKKGNQVITIKTQDVQKGNYQLILTVTESGYASLSVINNDQQPITFNGYLAEPKVKKDQAIATP